VQSVNGYSNTIVDGNWPAYTTVVFHVNNTGAVLSGLTITNGFAITNTLGPSPTVRNFAVGVFFRGSLITNCLITGNVFSNTVGGQSLQGGVAIGIESGTVSHCIIRGNKAIGNWVFGCGITAKGGIAANPTIIKNCDVDYNQSSTDSGALRLLFPGNATAIYCNVHDNARVGIDMNGGYGVVDSCISSNNRIGLLFDSNYDPIANCGIARNCLIMSNGVYGVYFNQRLGSQKLENCTVVSNDVGVFFDSMTQSVFMAVNSIIYYNTTANWKHGGTNISYTNCCTYPIPTNLPGISIGTGNITNEPMFAERSSRNYRLGANSPCINTGTNQSWMTGAVDLDGRMRIRYGTVDMGAYERIISGTIYGFR